METAELFGESTRWAEMVEYADAIPPDELLTACTGDDNLLQALHRYASALEQAADDARRARLALILRLGDVQRLNE